MAEGSVLDRPPLLEEVCMGQSCVTDPQTVNNRLFFSCESSEMEGRNNRLDCVEFDGLCGMSTVPAVLPSLFDECPDHWE